MTDRDDDAQDLEPQAEVGEKPEAALEPDGARWVRAFRDGQMRSAEVGDFSKRVREINQGPDGGRGGPS